MAQRACVCMWIYLQNFCTQKCLHLNASLHVLQTCESVCAHAFFCLGLCVGLLRDCSLLIGALLPSAAICCLTKQTAQLDQSHVGHQHSSGTSVDELISRFVSISSAASLSLSLSLCFKEERGGQRIYRLGLLKNEDSCHQLFTMYSKYAGNVLLTLSHFQHIQSLQTGSEIPS